MITTKSTLTEILTKYPAKGIPFDKAVVLFIFTIILFDTVLISSKILKTISVFVKAVI